MLFFGHIGLTMGAAFLIERASRRPGIPAGAPKLHAPASPDRRRLGVDYRMVLVGSLLPDIIDKPLGLIILRSSLSTGRTIGHTLLFTLLLTAVGLAVSKKCNSLTLLTLALGSFTHLVFDEMWLEPVTLFWPLLGFSFPPIDQAGWLIRVLKHALADPRAYVPELAGLLAIVLLLRRAAARKRLKDFLSHGQLP